MSRLLQWAAIAALIAAALALGALAEGDPGETANVDTIAADLRCPVCQGLSVKDSDSPAARNIRADIGRRLAGGETAADIRRAYVDRYGEWILLRPATTGLDGLVWAIPAAVTAAGAVVIGAALWRWRRQGRAPTEDDRRLVASARAAELAP